MTANIKHAEALALIFSTRDYQGTHPQPIATPIKSAKLIAYQRIAGGISAEIVDRGTRRHLHLYSADHPELMRLGDCDRATLQGALMAVQREVGNAA